MANQPDELCRKHQTFGCETCPPSGNRLNIDDRWLLQMLPAQVIWAGPAASKPATPPVVEG